MASQLLAIGTTAADSSDVTIEAGTPRAFGLNDAAGPVVAEGAYVAVQVKDADDRYFQIAKLSRSNAFIRLSDAGVYRFSRRAGVSCGVFEF